MPGRVPVCHQSGPASHEVALPYRVFVRISLAPVSVERSPRALHPFGCELQGLREVRLRSSLSSRHGILSWTYALLQSPPGFEPPLVPPSLPQAEAPVSPTTSSREVSRPFSVSPHDAAAFGLARLASPDHLRLQVFSTSWRLHPPRAWWPCFMPHPLLGLHPSELCSSRAAVRRLRRPCPLVVQANPNHASRAPQTAETDHHTLRRSAPQTEA
jgi:hypothetical protein